MPGEAAKEFVRWLEENNLDYYQEALDKEGYDDLESFSMIPDEEIEQLCDQVKMRPGHRRKMPALIARAKEDFTQELQIQKELKAAELSRRMREIKGEQGKLKNQETHKVEQSKISRPPESTSDPSTAVQTTLPEGKR